MTETQTAALIGAAFVVVFGVIGGYFFYMGLKSRRLAKESELWPTTAGTVLVSSVTKKTTRGKQGVITHYTPNVRYSYSVGGAGYECEVIRFGDMETGSSKAAQEVIDRYPEGSPVTVRYDRANPHQAALETQSAAGTQLVLGAFLALFPLMIVAIVVVIVATS